MVLEQLGIAFVGAVFGTVFGFFISIFWEQRKEQKEIKKLKQLLQDDFKRLFDIMHEEFSLVNTHLESEHNMKLIVDELISKKLDTQFVVKYHVSLEFNFWKVISDNGSLIKLNLDEIKHTKNLYQFISEYSALLEQEYQKWLGLLGSKVGYIDSLTDDDKKEILHSTYLYFVAVHEYCESMIDVLYEEAENFDWIKHHMK